jgi:hypothetical protein
MYYLSAFHVSQKLRFFLMAGFIFTVAASAGTTVAQAQTGNAEDCPVPDQHPRLIEFDAPGATTVNAPLCSGQCGTTPFANNDAGTVVGTYTDEYVVPHGFIRKRDGHIISFDAPGAGLASELDQGTLPYAINDRDVIAGQYQAPDFLYHAFIRWPDGSYESFEAPDAGTTAQQVVGGPTVGTLAYDINSDGTTAGDYFDENSVSHGFVRSRSGQIQEFDPPNSVYTSVCEETCLNRDGTATGSFLDASSVSHGWLRHADGSIEVFDAPGAGTGQYTGTAPASINEEGEIAGYVITNAGAPTAFVRHRDGSFANYLYPGSLGTVFYSVNRFGVTAGDYLDSDVVFHGISRSRSGEVKIFDAPDAGTGQYQGTRSSTNNARGEVAGWVTDTSGLNHGFVWVP